MLKSIFAVAFAVTLPALSLADESGFTTIFNGKDLTGWDGQPGSWEVKDGVIHCTGEAKEKNWLIYREQEPTDFILRLEFKWDKGNSGVQVRSDDLGEWQIFGYQVEVAKQDVMGLWHHSLLAKEHPKKGDRQLLTTAGQVSIIDEKGEKTIVDTSDPAMIQAVYKENEWNEMEVLVKGETLVQKINGIVFSTLIDKDPEMSRKKGFIALQDHGKGCDVSFRNLKIKLLE